ncbi:MAG: hypothetical protein GU357_04465 [Thermofilum sp.]|jgi:hypothetical protein|nr:hypothetical protein [Thermofilum sp.]
MVGKAFCKGVSTRIVKIGKRSIERVRRQHVSLSVFVLGAIIQFYLFLKEAGPLAVLSFMLALLILIIEIAGRVIRVIIKEKIEFKIPGSIMKLVGKTIQGVRVLHDFLLLISEGIISAFMLLVLYVVYANFVYVSFEVLHSPYFVSVDKGGVLVMVFTVNYLVPVIITGIFVGLAMRYIRDLPTFVTALLLLILLVSYTGVVILGQWLYSVKVEEMKNIYATRCTLENAWSIAYATNKNFMFTYRVNVPKPRQLMIPGDDRYLWVPRGLIAVADTGTCEDFAIELTTLLRDVLGCEARVVAFEDYDHALPEVKIDGVWYVLDISYTTPAGPVRAGDYWMYLNNTGYSKIIAEAKGLVDRETGKDVSSEHGFMPRG